MKEPTSRLSRDRWASRVGRSRATAVGIWLGMLLGALVATSSMVSAAMNPSSPAVDRPAVLQPMNATGTYIPEPTSQHSLGPRHDASFGMLVRDSVHAGHVQARGV